jgi:hypothetical protein
MMTLNSGHVSDPPTMMMMKNLFSPLLDYHDRGINLIGKKTDFFLFEKFRLRENQFHFRHSVFYSQLK